MNELNIAPVLIGADINCYSLARAFHEEYGTPSIVFGRMCLGAIKNSKIIDFHEDKKISDKTYMITLLRNLGENLIKDGKKPILMGCSDLYVENLIDCKKSLDDLYVMPYMTKELKDNIINKEKFYALCDKYDIDHPKTTIYEYQSNIQIPDDMRYPLVLKPADTVQFWNKKFDGMHKVYYANNLEQVKKSLEEMYSNSYDGNIIIQEYIPGDDTHMWTPTCYSDKNGKVKMITLGHVLLEEHVPTAIGNDATILVGYNENLMMTLKNFLEEIGYVGFCNCDIKYDARDGKFKIFEINIRQGRSHYHVTACGNNIARYVVDDYILNKKMDLKLQKKPHFWSLVPFSVVKKFVRDDDIIDKCKSLIKSGDTSSSFFYDYDLKGNFRRKLYIYLNYYNHIRKFNKYYKIDEK